MRIRRRIFGWLIGITGFLLIILIVSAVLAPKLIKLESVKEYIVKRFEAEISGQIDYQQIDLSWFPRPHAAIHNITFSLSEEVNGEIAALRVYPKILPLLWGSVELARLRVSDSIYNINISESLPQDPSTQRDFALSRMITEIRNRLHEFPQFTLSGLNVTVGNGTVNIFDGDRQVFGFRNLEAAYSRKAQKADFDLTCKSTLWNDISVSGWLDTKKFNSRGNIRLAEFRPQALSNFFFPDSALKITEALANLVIDFELKGTDRLQANLQGSIPLLKITRNDRAFEVNGILVDSSLKLTDRDATLGLEKLTMLNPHINLAGEMKFEPEQSQVSVNLEGQDFDLPSIRKIVLDMGKGSQTVQTVFNVLRSGQVPKISLNTQGQRLQDLAVFENMVIRGEILDGNIFIPGVDLDLKRVAGTVVILDSILQGYDLKAQMGGSLGKNGRLTLGLNQHVSPFDLDIQIHADLSQLPPILKRVVNYDPFLNELALIRSIEGEALGKLSLSKPAKTMRVRVETSEAQFTADYTRFPYPINFTGGRFLYDGQQVNLDNFDVRAAKSIYSINSATLTWQKETHFKLNSKGATLAMDELYPWLVSTGFIQGGLMEIRATDGFIHFDQSKVSGPLLRPRAWKILSSGKFDHLKLRSTRLPSPVEIVQGQFGCQDTRLILTNLEATIGKSSFSQINGGLDWGTADRLALATASTNINVDEFYPWLVKYFGTDEDLKKSPPIRGSLSFKSLTLRGPLSRFDGRPFSASGKFNSSIFESDLFPAPIQLENGDFIWQGEHMAITNCNGTAGKSAYSQLSMTLDWGKAALLTAGSKSMTLFAGEIWPWLSTLQSADAGLNDISITRGNAVLHDVRFSMPLNRADQWRISATGDLHDITAGADFLDPSISLESGKFILTERNLEEIPHNCIKLGSTRLSWGESQITLIGDIYFSPQSLFADLAISLDSADWTRLEKIINFAQGREDKARKPSKTVVTADLRINAEKFSYTDYVFQPLKAAVAVEPAETMITVEEADLCDISINGFIKATGQSIEYYLVPSARGKDLDSTLACLSREKASASGTYNLSGEVMANAKTRATTRIYSGGLDFNAKKGRIYKLGLLAKIFAILNVTEIYRGEVPDLVGDGFAYDTMTIKAKFEGKKMVMEECTIDGASMGLACDGEIDLAEQKINLVILVAPFKTVDRLVKKIPLISTVLGGKLVSIPFRAKGKLENPKVIPLSPTAVGSGVLGVMERTLKLPITIIQPLIPREGDNKGQSGQDTDIKPEPQ